MKVLLDVKDNKAKFIMELLTNFSFVKAKQITNEKLFDEQYLQMFNPTAYNHRNRKIMPAKKAKSYLDENVDNETDEELKET